MTTKSKTFTIREFLDNMEKNGFPKAAGSYVRIDELTIWRALKDEEYGSISGACAFGQAALNLHVPASVLDSTVSALSHSLAENIIKLNDKTETSVPEIARIMKERYSYLLDENITVAWYSWEAEDSE